MEVKEKVMRQVMEQIRINSLKDITMDEIARELGMSKRTLYENFSSKEELIKQSVEFFMEDFHEKMEREAGKETNSIRQILHLSLVMVSISSKVDLKKVEELQKTYPEIFTTMLTMHKRLSDEFLRDLIIEAQKQGYIVKPIDVDIIRNLIYVSIYEPSTDVFNETRPKYKSIVLFAMHFFIIIRGICTKKGLEEFNDFYKKNIKDLTEETIKVDFD
jgi:AcrR family transcriptional regulator